MLTFLGIEMDSVAMVLRLPDDKLQRLRGTLAQWEKKRHATKHELQVLIGLLNQAAAVVQDPSASGSQSQIKRRLPRGRGMVGDIPPVVERDRPVSRPAARRNRGLGRVWFVGLRGL